MNRILKSITKLEGNNYDEMKAGEFSIKIQMMMIEDNDGEFSIEREVIVSDRGDGKRGKVDLCFTDKYGKRIGIEIDRMSPRAKSIFKLNELECDEAYVITRSPIKIIKIK